MCWQCDNPDRTIEDYFAEVRETIRTHGWMVQYVESDRTPYAYTIGLHDWGLPELFDHRRFPAACHAAAEHGGP